MRMYDVLLNNLLNRLEYQDKQGTYKLSGNITKDEYDALEAAVRAYKQTAKK